MQYGNAVAVPVEVRKRFRLIGNGQIDERDDFAEDIRAGLTAEPKHLPCRHIYDAEGSRLFELICEQPEYYLTRTEQEILDSHADTIAEELDDCDALVELGSGNSAKTRTILEALLRRRGTFHYVPLDISREILVHNAVDMLNTYDGLEVTAVAAEYRAGLRHVHDNIEGHKCVAWLGSSIGNYSREDARELTHEITDAVDNGGKLLVGIDLRKDAETLENAYDDAAGVTTAFNTNILHRINRELGGDFSIDQFEYSARYDNESGAVQMGQISKTHQSVHVKKLDLDVTFEENEHMLTERSQKYNHDEIEALATHCGATLSRQWLDAKRRMTLNVMTV